MAHHKRLLIIIAVVLLALPLVLAAVLMLIGNTDPGRRLIERTTDRLTHGGVLLQGLAGRFPDQLTLSRLQLRDPQGLWLEIDDLRLDWSALPMIRRDARAASLQAARVAKARGLPLEKVQAFLAANTEGRDLGFLGEARVNVLRLNIALDREGAAAK